MSKRPNFILCITDQQRADFLGCYGHPVLRTPCTDGMRPVIKLARLGMHTGLAT